MIEQINKLVAAYFEPEEIESANLFGNKIIVTVKNTTRAAPELQKELEALPKIEKVSIVYTGEKKQTGFKAQSEKIALPTVKKIIGVASGKGGVGKSTTAVNLALGLKKKGLKVALFDADIYGPSIPTMLGFEEIAPVSFDGKNFEAFEKYGIKAMSVGTLVDKSQPLIWRGPKATGAIEQLLIQTNWGEIDVMVIDMPPGTGDIQIMLSQKLNLDGIVIVSTPQDVALIDAVKGVNMFEKIGVKILGIVENMSYYICPKCGDKEYIFGCNGAKEAAQNLGVKFLGEIPLDANIRAHADAGTPIVEAEPDSTNAQAYLEIAQKITEDL